MPIIVCNERVMSFMFNTLASNETRGRLFSSLFIAAHQFFIKKKPTTTDFVGGALEGLSSSAKMFVATNHSHTLRIGDDRKSVKRNNRFLPMQLGPYCRKRDREATTLLRCTNLPVVNVRNSTDTTSWRFTA